MNPLDTREFADLSLRLAPPMGIKLAGAAQDEGVLEGYASVWAGLPGGEADSYGDQIKKGAYSATLEAHRQAGTMPVMLWSHDLAKPIGRYIECREDDRGLYVRGQLNLETSAGKEAFLHLKAKDIGALSIGFRIADAGYELQKDGSRLLTAIDLYEISVVSIGAAHAARITEIKSLGSQRELERHLHDAAGLSRKDARAVAARGFAGIAGGEPDEAALADLARRMDSALEEIRAFHKPYYYR